MWEVGIAVFVLFMGYLAVAMLNYRDGYKAGYEQGTKDRKREIITYGFGNGGSKDRS